MPKATSIRVTVESLSAGASAPRGSPAAGGRSSWRTWPSAPENIPAAPFSLSANA
eukprot:CAMPEP_0175606654 /NCGR_PEP_ID=MMETSP0096-20121207/60828_1 /TAXON_ID=311494 /ORGANISM="Alexandrium monilatum, Strain CCMP3105" /LENGTH=54 /DNA_ID=CAMNT_0016911493 /DNA_START=60 /DNA_END=222 /DNA_ORIENTATION=-